MLWLKNQKLPLLMITGLMIFSQFAQGADMEAGRDIYNRCSGCHSLEQNRTGPKHCGLFERKAGTAKDFVYSQTMRESNIIWNAKTLDAFLKAPLQNIPGTTMGFAGIKSDKEREDLIAYLREASISQVCQ